MAKILQFHQRSRRGGSSRGGWSPPPPQQVIDEQAIKRIALLTRELLTFEEGRTKVRALHEQIATKPWQKHLARAASGVSARYADLAAFSAYGFQQDLLDRCQQAESQLHRADAACSAYVGLVCTEAERAYREQYRSLVLPQVH